MSRPVCRNIHGWIEKFSDCTQDHNSFNYASLILDNFNKQLLLKINKYTSYSFSFYRRFSGFKDQQF